MTAQPPEPLVSGLRQIGLSSADPRALAGFYRGALNLSLLFEAGGMIFLDAGNGVRLMIGPKSAEHPPGGGPMFYFEPILWDLAESAVMSAGGKFLGAAMTLQRAEGRELKLRAFKDPEGHHLALLGWRASS